MVSIIMGICAFLIAICFSVMEVKAAQEEDYTVSAVCFALSVIHYILTAYAWFG